MQEWLEAFLDSDSGGSLSLDKYAEVAQVLSALGAMDPARLRRAWVDFSDADWSPDAAAGATLPVELPTTYAALFGAGSTESSGGVVTPLLMQTEVEAAEMPHSKRQQ